MQTLRETRRDFRNTPNHSKTRHIVVCTRAFCWKEALFLCLHFHYVIIGLSCNCFSLSMTEMEVSHMFMKENVHRPIP